MNPSHTHGIGEHSHGDHAHSHGVGGHSHGGEGHVGAVSLQAHSAAAHGPSSDGRVLYVDCFAGASGDMLLGALVDVGLSLEELKAALAKLGLAGYEVAADCALSHGLTGTQFHVDEVPVEGASAFPARHLHDIRQIVALYRREREHS